MTLKLKSSSSFILPTSIACVVKLHLILLLACMLRSVWQHLRFPFSILLMPVFLFSMSELPVSHSYDSNLLLLFLILHVLVYPSSNAFNSLQDQDTGSIGLIKNPLPASPHLRWITIVMDMTAIILSAFIHMKLGIAVFIYILFSRLYSYRPVRLKQYAFVSFAIVFIFQGCWIYYMVQLTAEQMNWVQSLPQALCAGCMIGAIYPLSQIYQHEQDLQDGVVSLSYKLGCRGTFIFTSGLFLMAAVLFTISHIQHAMLSVLIFLSFQLPVIFFFLYWARLVWLDASYANYKLSIRMSILASLCMNACFILLNFCKPA